VDNNSFASPAFSTPSFYDRLSFSSPANSSHPKLLAAAQFSD